ncbi:MAG: dihydroorotase, partial [Gammaproteobacteria bacterium]|nr:dihydroorotase [Gammaproteobacteria bacterium]
MSKGILVKNARMVNEGSIAEGDLLISDGRIERIDTEISATGEVRVLEADGRLLLPGMIDDQVHFR